MEASIEYIGPLTHNVADNALFLEVLADDGEGDRPDYTGELEKGAAGLKIAALKEGFGWPSSMAKVDRCARSAAAARNPGPQRDASGDEIMMAAFGDTLNTCQFNAIGHPAISIPCGRVDGLPVALMLAGRHHAEQTIYRAAYAFEQSTDWRER